MYTSGKRMDTLRGRKGPSEQAETGVTRAFQGHHRWEWRDLPEERLNVGGGGRRGCVAVHAARDLLGGAAGVGLLPLLSMIVSIEDLTDFVGFVALNSINRCLPPATLVGRDLAVLALACYSHNAVY